MTIRTLSLLLIRLMALGEALYFLLGVSAESRSLWNSLFADGGEVAIILLIPFLGLLTLWIAAPFIAAHITRFDMLDREICVSCSESEFLRIGLRLLGAILLVEALRELLNIPFASERIANTSIRHVCVSVAAGSCLFFAAGYFDKFFSRFKRGKAIFGGAQR